MLQLKANISRRIRLSFSVVECQSTGAYGNDALCSTVTDQKIFLSGIVNLYIFPMSRQKIIDGITTIQISTLST